MTSNCNLDILTTHLDSPVPLQGQEGEIIPRGVDNTPHNAFGVKHLAHQSFKPAIGEISHVVNNVVQKCDDQSPEIHKGLVRDEEIHWLPTQLRTTKKHKHHQNVTW